MLSSRAPKKIKALPADQRRRVLEKIAAMSDNLAGDIKKLTNFMPEYRLRVGDYRALFQIEGSRVTIFRVVHRRAAYQ